MNDLGAQRPHIDKGAGGQLEVFGNAPIEAQALITILRVTPLHGIAGAKEAFHCESGWW